MIKKMTWSEEKETGKRQTVLALATGFVLFFTVEERPGSPKKPVSDSDVCA